MPARTPSSSAGRVALAVTAAVVAALAMHAIGPALRYGSPSPVFQDVRLFLPLVTGALTAYFLLGSWLTARWRSAFAGPALRRAFRFTLFFGCIILATAPEMVLLGRGTLGPEVYGGVVDSGAVFLLFVLLLRREADGPADRSAVRGSPPPRREWPAALAAGASVAAMFGGVRLGLYLALDAGPSGSGPLAWFASAALAGFWVGATYVWLPWRDPRSRPGALRYTARFFAPAWLGGTAFVPLFVNVQPATLAATFTGDLVAVAAGLAAFRRASRS